VFGVLTGSRPAAGQDSIQPLYDGGVNLGDESPGLGHRFVTDLHTQLTYPFGLATRDPSRFFLGSLGISALILSDVTTYGALTTPSFIRHERMVGPARTLSRMGDGTSALALIAGFGLVGFVGGSEHEKQTSVMLAEAVATSSVWTGALKFLAGRERPRDLEEVSSDWTGPASAFDNDRGHVANASFPSGHSTGAWAAATILAHQYPSKHVVPVLAYSTAAAVSYSRMVVGAHWLSDVVVGGLIGYGCARQVISSRESGDDTHMSRLHFMIDPAGQEKSVGVAVDF
jgi:membrane-associated phospholipid phosphatase